MIPLAFVKGHLNWVGGEGGGEDACGREFVPDVLAALGGGHHLDNDLGPLALGYRSGLLGGADRFAVGGVEGHRLTTRHCLKRVLALARVGFAQRLRAYR